MIIRINCKPKTGESNNFKSKNSLLKSAKGQNLKIELENSVFRNEALKNNVSQKNMNLLVKNLENKVSEDLSVNNCINLQGKVNKCMSINDKKTEKSKVAQKKIICLNKTCCNVKSLANKNKGKISFVCNKIRVFMCISYKHGNFKWTKIKKNSFRKISNILSNQELSLKDNKKNNGSNKLSQALSYALVREDFYLACLIEGLRYKLEKLAYLQAWKCISLLRLYANAFILSFAIPPYRFFER